MHVQQRGQFAGRGGGDEVRLYVVSSGLNNKYAYYLFISTNSDRAYALPHFWANCKLQTNILHFTRSIRKRFTHTQLLLASDFRGLRGFVVVKCKSIT